MNPIQPGAIKPFLRPGIKEFVVLPPSAGAIQGLAWCDGRAIVACENASYAIGQDGIVIEIQPKFDAINP